jgi:putative transposase
VASVTRHTTFSFTLLPNRDQEQALRRHVGAARFAFNQCLRLVMNALDAKQQSDRIDTLDTSPTENTSANESTSATENRVPWSGFDLINAFNTWKRSTEAGAEEAGPGLSWRAEVCQQVFEEAAVDLGRALEAFSSGRKGERAGKKPKFPKFKRKATARQAFRLRSKGSGKAAAIRVGEGEQARMVRLPKLGSLCVRECTRRLRRMLRKDRAKILFATVSTREGGRWRVSLNVQALPLHLGRRTRGEATSPVGIDRGLKTFAVVADDEGRELERIDSPRPLQGLLPKLRRQSRALSRKQAGSRNRFRERQRLSRLHGRISNIRHDFLHRHSSRLAQIHSHLVIEQLSISGLIRTRLARSIADSSWALFGTWLVYPAAWYGAELTIADRFYPSTRRCARCGTVGEALSLSERIFRCSSCGHEADRDTNAAACLAQYPRVVYSPKAPASSAWPHVAAKHAETQNVCGEESAGSRPVWSVRETVLYEAERTSVQRPRRAVLFETVNTL